MHEHGVADRILEVVLARAALAGADRVTEVHLEIGEDAGISAESIEMYWEHVREGTPAEGARLRIVASPDPASFRTPPRLGGGRRHLDHRQQRQCRRGLQ